MLLAACAGARDKHQSQRAFVAGEHLYQLVYWRKAAADGPYQQLIASFSLL